MFEEISILQENLQLSDELYEKFLKLSDNFANKLNNKLQSTNYYKTNRNASNPIHDIKIGKMGELAACYYLVKRGFPKVFPDFEVKSGKQKNWDCDLPFYEKDNNFPNCHVKTLDEKSASYVKRNCGDQYSWTFQYGNINGNGGRDNLFSTPDSKELVVFVYIDSLDSGNVQIVAISPFNLIFNLFKDPISIKLKGLKKCIYLRI